MNFIEQLVAGYPSAGVTPHAFQYKPDWKAWLKLFRYMRSLPF